MTEKERHDSEVNRPAASGSKVIFIGASTGGTEALKAFLLNIPSTCPPILVVQHMPASFTGAFSARLNQISQTRVIESQGNEILRMGEVYIAPGHSHLRVQKTKLGYVTELLSTPPVNHHRPSVDVLFDSAAELLGKNAVGIIMTGMGKDGAKGLLRMRQAGARTFGQNEATCAVYGMPREAMLMGAVQEEGTPVELALRVMSFIAKGH